MTRAPGWWRADAPHWNGRTVALIALAAFIFGGSGVFALITDLNREEVQAPTDAHASQEAPAQISQLCAADSETPVASGWGPERPTYHDDTFPASLTFNSTSANANIGDERNFVGIRPEEAAEDVKWVDSQEVVNGAVYVVRVYVRLDGPASHSATDVKLAVNLPTCTAHRIGLAAFISSGDTFPGTVWDGAAFWSRRDFNLAVVPDSGRVFGNFQDGRAFSMVDIFMSEGIQLGSRDLDGIFWPGYKDAVYVTFKVRAQVAAG